MTPVPHEQQISGLSHTDCDDFLPTQINSATKFL